MRIGRFRFSSLSFIVICVSLELSCAPLPSASPDMIDFPRLSITGFSIFTSSDRYSVISVISMSFAESELRRMFFAAAGRVRLRRDEGAEETVWRRAVHWQWICSICRSWLEKERFWEKRQRSAVKSEDAKPPSGKVTTRINETREWKTGIVDLFVLLIVQIESVFVLQQRSIDGATATIETNREKKNPFRETIISTSLANMSCFLVFSSTRLRGRAYDDFYALPNQSKPTNIPSVKIPQYL